ncbi:HDOD domain-containing protein [Massilia atriviolacea]|uniref:HDOD domain-containing protein n=1 Tax=Massilia atriviolacea TaxID=2495579 RepID=A0A430HIS7_9BURK|nr:HDOD domain-containing protein [Massilia atriviolacea]RSZ57412.1 HDOD domain-containing protein [Massilia atriviolacea]
MSAVMPTSIDDVVKRIRDLPSLSAVVVELLSSMEQEDIDVHVLGGKIALDQSLTAKTLRLANSSFYGMSSKVTTIQQAISVLGFHSIRTLVTACAVTASFPSNAAGGIDLQAFWRHSVATAVCAKLLALHLKLNPDTAFTAGLLHDIGTLVLATRFPDAYAAMLAFRKEHDCYTIEAERAVIGVDHAAAGAALAAYWKFPADMQEAVAGHHQLDAAGKPTLPLLIHAANVIAHALDLSGEPDDLVPPMPQALWMTLALSEDDCASLFRDTESTFVDMCKILVT